MIREFPILYDLTHPKYSDAGSKVKAWRRVAERTKEPEAACRKTWSNLREAYRRAIKRRKNAGDQATIRKWRYEEEMAFLSRYYKERPTDTTAAVTSEDSKDTILEPKICEIADIISLSTKNTSRPEPASPEHWSVYRKKRKAKETKKPAAATVMDYLIEDNKVKEADEVEQFCRCIATVLRKFSPYDLAMAKKNIFSIISELEFRQFRGNGTNSSSFAEHLEDGNL